jgi:Domain of unknown function (DUF4272)
MFNLIKNIFTSKDNRIIQCSFCEWSPDGEIHWACTCGYDWNTFETKGQCPKCKEQWKDTWCPGCGKSSPHSDWYKTKEDLEKIEATSDKIFRQKKKSLEQKLINYGIKNYRVSYPQFFDFSKKEFKTPYEVGCRMIILYTISHCVHNLDEREEIIEWLESENLWQKVSPIERKFLKNPIPERKELINLSWRIESALTLGWALNLIPILPKLNKKDNEDSITKFFKVVPFICEPTTQFLQNLEFRNVDEIYEENLINELATTYFRDLFFSGKEDKTNINRLTSFERHLVLNWLRSFMGIEDWDETDTST